MKNLAENATNRNKTNSGQITSDDFDVKKSVSWQMMKFRNVKMDVYCIYLS